jgi:outer membrane biosynthesis protein TonB
LKFEKVEVSGLVVLFIGVILLAATFYSAFVFLFGDVTILASVDLAELFGNALAPLIEAVIHVLYLGIMGWIGSVTTIRAVQLLKKDKEASPQPQPKPTAAPTTTQAQPKPEAQKDVKEPKKEDPGKAAAPQPPTEPKHEVIEKTPEKIAEPVAA